MQEVFEKIIERLETERLKREEQLRTCHDSDAEDYFRCKMSGLADAIEIVKQEAEDYKNGWIPCSERLPEESGTYNVTAFDGGKYRSTSAKWQKISESWNLSGARAYWRVVAWQPLPDPYQPKGE